MNTNPCFLFKALAILLLGFSFCVITPNTSFGQEPIIIDHTCTDISQIPAYWLEQAKQLTIHYAHTSHGSQINTGILNLESQDSTYSVAIRTSTAEGLPPQENPPALRMYDGNPPETYINPDDYWDGDPGRNRTRAVADTGDYGFSMWSWCGQVSSATQSYIQEYLDTLNQFGAEYPAMRFIFMTGHLDGTGSSGNLHIRNEQIRNYCIVNHKVLFDFADIERYDPDGTDYLDLAGTDNCDYTGGNWADEWCAAHPGSDLCDACDCAHSKALNCNQKARAFWWMMARLAGWNPDGGPSADFSANPTTGTAPLEVSFTDGSTGDIDTWSWNFGDGGTSTEQSPAHTYSDPGTYTVTLEVTGPGGSDTRTRANYITVNAALTQYDLTVNTVGQGSVTLDPAGGSYNAGTEVTLTPAPNAGSAFNGWTGDLSGYCNPATIFMDADKTITAAFDVDGDTDGISDAEEDASPNGGDGNSDGLDDSDQLNVASFHTQDAADYVTLESGPGTALADCHAVSKPSTSGAPSGVAFPYHFFSFTINGVGAGAPTTLTLYLPAGANPTTYWKYGPTGSNQNDHWYEFLHNGQTGAQISGNAIILHFVDGMRGDDDLTANGVIVDQGGPGVSAGSGGNSSVESDGCFIETLFPPSSR